MSFPLIATAVQAYGAATSAMGSYYGAKGQKMALEAQASMDRVNAQSSAMALTGQADLEFLNAQAEFNSAVLSAEFSSFRDTTAARLDRMATLHQVEMEGTARVNQAELGQMSSMSKAELDYIGTQRNADNLRTEADIGILRSETQAQALEMSAIMDERNAAIRELTAQSAMLRGEQQEQDARLKFAQAKSTATASMAARGIDLGEGAALAVRAGHDLMAENTAIRIQQQALMEAFGQRAQAENDLISAASRRAHAGNTRTMANLDAGLRRSNADFAETMAGINKATTRRLTDAEVLAERATFATNKTAATALTDAQVTATEAISTAQTTAAKALADAGLIIATANKNYKHTMADVMVKNASAAAMLKSATAASINPKAVAMGTLLSGAGQVAQSWYAYTKTKKGTN